MVDMDMEAGVGAEGANEEPLITIMEEAVVVATEEREPGQTRLPWATPASDTGTV